MRSSRINMALSNNHIEHGRGPAFSRPFFHGAPAMLLSAPVPKGVVLLSAPVPKGVSQKVPFLAL